MEFWKKLLKLLEPIKKQLAWVLVTSIFFEGFRLLGPYLFKEILDTISELSKEQFNRLILLVALMFIVYTLINIIDYYLDKKIFNVFLTVEKFLPIQAQEKLVFLSLGYHEKENTGTKIVKVQKGVDNLVRLLSDMMMEVAPTIFQAILTFLLMLWFDWQMALVFSIAIPIFIVMTYKLNKKLYPLRKKRHDQYEVASGKMTQAIMNINTVKSYVQEPREVEEYTDIRNSIYKEESAEWDMMIRMNFLRNMVINIGRVAVILFGVYKTFNGSMSIGTLVFFITLSEKVYFSLFRISRTYDRIQEATTSVDRLSNLLEQETEVKNPRNGIKPKVKGKIDFEHVSFSYHNQKNKKTAHAINDINFEINKGETVALVGPSGGGKSTIVKLLYRHYDVLSGKILIDGIELKKLDLPAYRSQLAIVPQEVEIFDVTIAENIAYGNPKANLDEIKKAARIANADQFINEMANGYDTLVGERGVRLSGGQKQRIGIARAIFSNPKILIFDEATSSLDSQSERLIQKSMRDISKDRTVIIIAHRLSTIQNADKIIVVKDGKIEETGDHKSLIEKKGGVYRRLVELQKMGEIVDDK
ncbi:MAG: ABC transporter ATP-binding protein [bacterium]